MILISPQGYQQIIADGLDPDAPVFGWENYVSSAEPEFDNEAFPGVNILNPSTASRWVSTDTGTQSITFNLTGVGGTDYFAIAAHNLGTTRKPFLVEGFDGDDYTPLTPGAGGVFLENNQPFVLRYALQEFESIRLTISSGGGGGFDPIVAFPQIGVVYCGPLMTCERKIHQGHTPLNLAGRVGVINGRRESGQFLGRLITGQSADNTVELRNLTPSWYRSTFDRFVRGTREKPFFFGWRPFSYPLETGYVWHEADPRPINQLSNGMMSVSLELGGIYE